MRCGTTWTGTSAIGFYRGSVESGSGTSMSSTGIGLCWSLTRPMTTTTIVRVDMDRLAASIINLRGHASLSGKGNGNERESGKENEKESGIEGESGHTIGIVLLAHAGVLLTTSIGTATIIRIMIILLLLLPLPLHLHTVTTSSSIRNSIHSRIHNAHPALINRSDSDTRVVLNHMESSIIQSMSTRSIPFTRPKRARAHIVRLAHCPDLIRLPTSNDLRALALSRRLRAIAMLSRDGTYHPP